MSIKMLASLISNRIRRLQLAFFVEAHHRKPQEFRSLAFRDVLLGQGSIDQLLKKAWMLLRQGGARFVLTPTSGRKALEERQVHRLRDDATLLGSLQPSSHRQAELVLEHVELLPLQRVTPLTQQLKHGHTRRQESTGKTITSLLFVYAFSQPSL